MAVAASCISLHGAEPTRVDFQRDIRPLLSDRCFHCHGPDETNRMADLRLDQPLVSEFLLKAGDPDSSELIRRICSNDPSEVMPPPEINKGLTDSEIQLLRNWVESGAEWKQHWAYEIPKRWPIPFAEDSNWPTNWIDQFLLASMRQHQLQPSPAADSVTLLRRLSFDLTGLPPPETLQATALDTEAGYQRAVEQLLESPHFGERMAVVWLDLVRYADTVGYHGDQDHSISPYRDWVIDALNAGMPFDQFTREQLAGDLVDQPTISSRIASGYNRLLQTTHEGGLQPGEYRAIYAADRVRNLSAVWLAATVGCAQCHDHKFDPYSMHDFYSLSAFFADVDDESHFKTGSNELPTRRDPELDLPTPIQKEQLDLLKREIAELEQKLSVDELSEGQKREFEQQRKLAESNQKSLKAQIRRSMVTVALKKPRLSRILPRGNWMDESGPEVLPEFPEFLLTSSSSSMALDSTVDVTAPRLTRLDLANWLVDPDQGAGLLTARVMVNRLWYLFFGKGIARDLIDFGGQGQPPTHPELLDNLAHHLVDSGWDLRSTIRLIVGSRAYRQSSSLTEDGRRLDPENKWFARQATYRLPAEMIRDNALEISGLLVKTLGGPSVRPYQPADYYRHLNFPTREYRANTDQDQWRRGVYVHWQRQFLHPMLRAFDATNREECTAERSRSNTPLAALTLLNDPTFVEAARALAETVLLAGGESSQPGQIDDQDRLQMLYRKATGRKPNSEQLESLHLLLEFNRDAFRDSPESTDRLLRTGMYPVANASEKLELAAWSEVCRAVLNLAETNLRY